MPYYKMVTRVDGGHTKAIKEIWQDRETLQRPDTKLIPRKATTGPGIVGSVLHRPQSCAPTNHETAPTNPDNNKHTPNPVESSKIDQENIPSTVHGLRLIHNLRLSNHPPSPLSPDPLTPLSHGRAHFTPTNTHKNDTKIKNQNHKRRRRKKICLMQKHQFQFQKKKRERGKKKKKKRHIHKPNSRTPGERKGKRKKKDGENQPCTPRIENTENINTQRAAQSSRSKSETKSDEQSDGSSRQSHSVSPPSGQTHLRRPRSRISTSPTVNPDQPGHCPSTGPLP